MSQYLWEKKVFGLTFSISVDNWIWHERDISFSSNICFAGGSLKTIGVYFLCCSIFDVLVVYSIRSFWLKYELPTEVLQKTFYKYSRSFHILIAWLHTLVDVFLENSFLRVMLLHTRFLWNSSCNFFCKERELESNQLTDYVNLIWSGNKKSPSRYSILFDETANLNNSSHL